MTKQELIQKLVDNHVDEIDKAVAKMESVENTLDFLYPDVESGMSEMIYRDYNKKKLVNVVKSIETNKHLFLGSEKTNVDLSFLFSDACKLLLNVCESVRCNEENGLSVYNRWKEEAVSEGRDTSQFDRAIDMYEDNLDIVKHAEYTLNETPGKDSFFKVLNSVLYLAKFNKDTETAAMSVLDAVRSGYITILNKEKETLLG